jgi:hypothetical protein
VSVENVEDEDDSAEETIHIASRVEQTIERCTQEGKALFENELEFRTLQVVRVEDDFFLLHLNGGSRGAFSDGKAGVAGHECETIEKSEARRLGLKWGYTPGEVAQETR